MEIQLAFAIISYQIIQGACLLPRIYDMFNSGSVSHTIWYRISSIMLIRVIILIPKTADSRKTSRTFSAFKNLPRQQRLGTLHFCFALVSICCCTWFCSHPLSLTVSGTIQHMTAFFLWDVLCEGTGMIHLSRTSYILLSYSS